MMIVLVGPKRSSDGGGGGGGYGISVVWSHSRERWQKVDKWW
jgi:hypothetical protein